MATPIEKRMEAHEDRLAWLEFLLRHENIKQRDILAASVERQAANERRATVARAKAKVGA